jgi:hypothetical protein
MFNFVVIDLVIVWKNIFKQRPEPGNVPLPVAEVIDRIPYGFFRCDLEKIIETAVGLDNP